MRAFDAILFDNDGVLVDTEGFYYQANREVLARFRVTLDRAAYIDLFLRDSKGAWDRLRERGVSEGEIAAARADRDRRYIELLVAGDAGSLLLPGVAAGLAALAGRFRLAIVTSSEPAPFAAVHARAGVLHHFELALTRDQYVLAKPDPEPYRLAVARLGVAPDRCLVVEDSERGLRAAKAAGLACWVVPSEMTRGGRFEGADAVLDDFSVVVNNLLA
ncbi:MAG TPA: HAD family phosphatase [Polyangia bacterium]|nr:HAD family phosphatase [Polyangia bacterium]